MDSDTNDSREIEIIRIKNRITNIVDTHFNNGEEIIYLSRLGIELGSDRTTLEKLTRVKFSQYIHENFDYQIRTTGQHKNILFLAPIGKDVKHPPISAPKFLPRFWAAFAKPLQDGEYERFINIKTLYFASAATEVVADDADNIRSISKEFIAPQDAPIDALQIFNRINRWIDNENLKVEDFVISRKRATDKKESLLAILVHALTSDQLRRVTLPLDVVKSLSDRKL